MWWFVPLAVFAVCASIRANELAPEKGGFWAALPAACSDVIARCIELARTLLDDVLTALEQWAGEHPELAKTLFSLAITLGCICVAVVFGLYWLREAIERIPQGF